MMKRLALRVEHPRLERHIDIHFHGGGPFAARAGRWARLCPRITSGARGGRALPPGKTRLSGLRPGRIYPVANRSHYPSIIIVEKDSHMVVCVCTAITESQLHDFARRSHLRFAKPAHTHKVI